MTWGSTVTTSTNCLPSFPSPHSLNPLGESLCTPLVRLVHQNFGQIILFYHFTKQVIIKRYNFLWIYFVLRSQELKHCYNKSTLLPFDITLFPLTLCHCNMTECQQDSQNTNFAVIQFYKKCCIELQCYLEHILCRWTLSYIKT